ncbi:uncharacterized protein LOC116413118 [Galleria mellonella]|uniref:Uncharacterized protein LOC116413118 n=1 Tax=Galleria mellonella TaxID=7137 RepID=A0ABM3M9R6_GALME|nr:uncharacterized protein LOC116413118 [Galleria mellonella]
MRIQAGGDIKITRAIYHYITVHVTHIVHDTPHQCRLCLLVPNITASSLSFSPDHVLNESVMCRGDVLDLGARLLGDVHQIHLLLHCEAQHAAFFILTEDAWTSFCLDDLTSDGSLQAGVFTIKPVWWSGGGSVRGTVWCRAPHAGLHTAALRVLASTAIARPLHLLADSLYFRRDHITLEAQEKNYDISSDDDPACEYYVHLGTAFPHRSLSATVQLVNHSSVSYSYYWSVRPWGICSCWEKEEATNGSLHSKNSSERLCVGAKKAKVKEQQVKYSFYMLVLKDIPKESFPCDCDAMIVNTETVESDSVPGVKFFAQKIRHGWGELRNLTPLVTSCTLRGGIH